MDTDNTFSITYRISNRGFNELELLHDNKKIGVLSEFFFIINKNSYTITKKNNVFQGTKTFIAKSNKGQCEIITENVAYNLGSNNTRANMIFEERQYDIEREPNSFLSDSKGIIKLYDNKELKGDLIETKRNYIFFFLKDEGVINLKLKHNSNLNYIDELIILALLVCRDALRPNTVI